MKVDVAKAIAAVLDNRDTVSFPGIGSLVLENLSAKIQEDGKSMSPPAVRLKLLDTETTNKALRKYIGKTYDLTKKEAEKVISKFNQSLMNGLVNYGEIKIKGVTYIKKAKGVTTIQPVNKFIKKYYGDLPVITLDKKSNLARSTKLTEGSLVSKAAPSGDKPSPVPILKESVVIKPYANLARTITTPSADSKGQGVPSIPKEAPKVSKPDLPVISKAAAQPTKPIVTPPVPKKEVAATSAAATSATKSTTIAAATAVTASSLNDKLGSPIAEKTKSINDIYQTKGTAESKPTRLSISESLAKAKEEVLEKRKETVATYTPIPPQREGLGCLFPSLGLLGLLLAAFLLYKGCYQTNSAQSDLGQTGVHNTELAHDDHGKVLNEGQSGIQDASQAEANSVGQAGHISGSGVISELESCTIITGVFTKYRNIEKMESRLQSAGYKVYKASQNGSTRVGFTFDCKGVNLPKYLNKVRRQISRKAWYLEPELYVDYE